MHIIQPPQTVHRPRGWVKRFTGGRVNLSLNKITHSIWYRLNSTHTKKIVFIFLYIENQLFYSEGIFFICKCTKKQRSVGAIWVEISTGIAAMAELRGGADRLLAVMMKGTQLYLENHFIQSQEGWLSFLIPRCYYVRILITGATCRIEADWWIFFFKLKCCLISVVRNADGLLWSLHPCLLEFSCMRQPGDWEKNDLVIWG